jgi:phytoene synthase
MAVTENQSVFGQLTLEAGVFDEATLSKDYAHCRQIMRAASKNYSFASNVLPPDKLHHVEAVYALMRVGDDRVDVSHEGFESPRAAIDDWEATYWRAFEAGDSPDPVMRAYLNTAITCGIPKEVMTAYFRAMREDITITRFETFDDLMHYMDGSAIPVGRAMTYILGVREPYARKDALAHADALSVGMQLSNFWRDVGYDWDIGRVYIPQEVLAEYGVTEDDIAAHNISPAFTAMMEDLLTRTEAFYAGAENGIRMLATGRWAVWSGLEIYRAILTSIRRNDYDVFTKKAGANMFGMVGLVARSWWNSRKS